MRKRNRYRHFIILLLILSMALSCFVGCNVPGETAETGETTDNGSTASAAESEFWIVADNAFADLFSAPIQIFREAHPDITVTVETFPNDAAEREVYMQQLQTQIMAGKGPDVYLMMDTSPLFQDVTQSMHHGLFTDISAYYDADTALDKEGLVPAVMDAGVLESARYVLPLRYSIPLLYVDIGKLEAAGLALDRLGNGLSGLEEVAKALGSDSVITGVNLGDTLLNLFPEMLDYKTDKVVLPEEELADFLQEYKNISTAMGKTSYVPTDYSYYISIGNFWATQRKVFSMDTGGWIDASTENDGTVYIGNSTTLTQNLRIARSLGIELAVLPLRTSDGSLTANVTAYGAVGAGCEDPGLAYEFLRTFLLKDNQWKNQNGSSEYLYALGWPVLPEGSGVPMDAGTWGAASKTIYTDQTCLEGWKERRAALDAAALTEEDFSVLNAQVSKAVFCASSFSELERKIDDQLDPSVNPNAANVDVHELAEEILQELLWYLAEG